MIVELVDALPKSPPEWQEAHSDQVVGGNLPNFVGDSIVLGSWGRDEVSDCDHIFQWLSHAGDDICKEEVSESHSSEGSDEDLEDGDGELPPGNPEATLEARLAAVAEEEQHQDDHEPCYPMAEVVVQFDLEECKLDANSEEEEHDSSQLVELMWRHFVLRVQLENVHVVNAELLEDVDVESASEAYEGDDEGEAQQGHIVGEQLIVVGARGCWHPEEDSDDEPEKGGGASKEHDGCEVLGAHLLLVLVQHLVGKVLVAIGEVLREKVP
jgi:hypothetical protein